MADFDTTYDRLECPHAGSCSYYEPMWDVSAATQEGKLTLEVECNSCKSRDHLMFDVTSNDRSSQVDFDVGDEFEITDSIRAFRRASKGDTGKVTAVANDPLYSSERVVVGVVAGIDSGSPYPVHLFSLEEFEKLAGDSIEFK